MHRLIEAKEQTKIYQHNFAPIQNSQDVFVSIQINYVSVQNTVNFWQKKFPLVHAVPCTDSRFPDASCIGST
jgi:hypothetical protein